MENHNSQQNAEGELNKFVEAPSLSSMWPYPLPVEKFPQFRNMFHDGTPTSSSNEIISQQQHHMQQQEQQMQQQQLQQQLQQQQIQQHLQQQQQQQMQLQQALQSQAQTQSQTPAANSVPVMGTLQTVLTTGINPNLNNGTVPSLTQGLSGVLPAQASVAHTNTVHAGHTIVSNSSQIHSIPTTVNSNNVKAREPTQMITRSRLQDLVREVDPNEQLDEEVEDVLLQMADDFVESAITAACLLAKHRKSNTLEVKDLQLHLERHWNMWIPGFGTDELRPYKRSSTTDAHKQRLTLIRRAQKKY